jgi:hypothetical protein
VAAAGKRNERGGAARGALAPGPRSGLVRQSATTHGIQSTGCNPSEIVWYSPKPHPHQTDKELSPNQIELLRLVGMLSSMTLH